MTIRGDFEKVTDQYGMISGEMNPTRESGNCLLMTAEYLWCLYNNWELQFSDVVEKSESIRKNCQIEKGLFRRGPSWPDQEGPDDLLGLASMSALPSGPKFAQDILAYGRAHKFHWGPFRFRYYYPNEFPDRNNDARAWLGRQRHLITFFRLCADERPNILDIAYLALVVATTGMIGKKPYENGGQDAFILSAIVCKAVRTKHWLLAIAERKFQKRLKASWPGGMRQVFTKYFGFNHPVAQWWVDV